MPIVVRSLSRAAIARIGDPLGMQLLVDVSLDADRPDLLDVAGPRTEAGAVEHVDDGFVSGLVSGCPPRESSQRPG